MELEDFSFRNAQVGDILHTSDTRPIPDGWHLVDGSELLAYEWPEFVRIVGITTPRFTLPTQQRANPHTHALIKLGARRPVPTSTAGLDLATRASQGLSVPEARTE